MHALQDGALRQAGKPEHTFVAKHVVTVFLNQDTEHFLKFALIEGLLAAIDKGRDVVVMRM